MFFGFYVFLFLRFLVTDAFAGSITLRVVAVNPSEESIQSVPIKVYLPVEVKPEDIIYKEDLGVAYDTQQGSYYVFGDYELKPKEVLEKEIEIKDIWVIDEAEIVNLRKEINNVFDAFKKAGYTDKVATLYDAIEKKLKEIEDIQKASANNPSQHISNFRYCLNLLNATKADLLAAKTLLAEISPKGLAAGLTWKIILFIIIFLGILGVGFYIIWQRQARLEAEVKPQEEELGSPEEKNEQEGEEP